MTGVKLDVHCPLPADMLAACHRLGLYPEPTFPQRMNDVEAGLKCDRDATASSLLRLAGSAICAQLL